MKAIIENADNGWVVTTEHDYADSDSDETFERKQVFCYDEEKLDSDSKEKHEALAKMFYFIMEYFAVYNSKHNSTRLNIDVKKQK